MGEYTRSLANREYNISPEDENYKEELLEVAKSFRTFDAALDEFILQKGYDGEPADVDAKIKFIKRKFDEAGISLDLRTPRNWFYNHKQGTNRDIAFQFCFAFQLTLDETQAFFRQVYLQRGIDCHDVNEAIYYYCISHRMTYCEAQKLIKMAPKKDKKGSIDLSGDVLFTGSIIKELDRFDTPDELLTFLNENSEQFGYNNATAYKNINEIWEDIVCDKGVICCEERLLYPNKTVFNKHRSVWDIYLQIFGLLDYDEVDNSKLFVMKGDRTLQPLFKGNSLLHPVARESFPDRQGLEGIIKGVYQSDEVVRKTIILLVFYRFWAKKCVKNNSSEYLSNPKEANRCLAAINKQLVDAGYPALYEGNPYDWIFMFAAQDEYPLSAFRYFMRELYLNQEEENDELQ